MTDYVVADTHFFHENVIKYSNRPYSSLSEMHKELINNWNKVVKPQDTVYHLGDFFITSVVEQVDSILSQLNGHVFMVQGNHDAWIKRLDRLRNKHKIIGVEDIKQIRCHVDGESHHVVMCHYPMRTWNKSHFGSICLHGHCHGSLNEENKRFRRHDVGVDSNNYTPVKLSDIVLSLLNRPKVDHHNI